MVVPKKSLKKKLPQHSVATDTRCGEAQRHAAVRPDSERQGALRFGQ